jgi:two-component system sensor histidine kinase YesM
MFQEQKQIAVSSLVSQSAKTVEEALKTISSVQSYLTGNSDIQQFLYNETNNISSSMRLEISDDFIMLNNFFTDKISLILIDNSDNTHTFFNDISDAEKKKIENLYTKYKNGRLKSNEILFTLPTSTYYELYIASLNPITKLDTKNVESHNVGTSVVISRVNIYKLLHNMEYSDNAGITFTNSHDGSKLSFTQNIKSAKSAIVSKTRSLGETPWKITGSLIYENQTSVIFRIIIMILIELFIVILLTFLIQIRILNKYVTAPVRAVVNFLDNFLLHNTSERLDISSVQEFKTLSQHINTMLDKSENISREIVYTQQKLYESEICEKEAVFYALQNQINPHFLYNTLECISGIALSYNAVEVMEVMDSLSYIMRYSLNPSLETTVESEIKALEEYFKIMKIRFPQKFTYNFDFDDNIWDKNTMRMLFQPIVENSFKHGLVLSERSGAIEIKGYQKDDKLIFKILDNGVGIAPAQLAELKRNIEKCPTDSYSGNSVGIVNIHRRIRLRYGDDYGIKIESREGEFTLVTIILPS